jgi:hypothetical protein
LRDNEFGPTGVDLVIGCFELGEHCAVHFIDGASLDSHCPSSNGSAAQSFWIVKCTLDSTAAIRLRSALHAMPAEPKQRSNRFAERGCGEGITFLRAVTNWILGAVSAAVDDKST